MENNPEANRSDLSHDKSKNISIYWQVYFDAKIGFRIGLKVIRKDVMPDSFKNKIDNILLELEKIRKKK